MFQIDDGTNKYNTTVAYGPNLTVDTVSITYIYGNNTAVNRSGTQATPYVIRATDSNRGGAQVATGTSITFWTTKNGAAYDNGNGATTNSTGYSTYNIDPTCSPTKYEVGHEYWKAGVTDSCYTLTNTTTNYSITIIGNLINTIESPAIGTEYLRGENVSINSVIQPTIQDDCSMGLSGVNNTIIFNHEDGTTNYSCASQDLGGGYYQCTRNTTDMRALWYNTTMTSWQQYYNNGTLLKSGHFFVKTIPVLQNDTLLTSLGGWGERFYFSLNVTDEDLDNVTINLYVKKNSTDTWGAAKNTTVLYGPINQSIALSWKGSEDCNNIGSWNYYFEASDTHFLSSTTTPKNFTIGKDDVQVYYINGDKSFTWRNGTYNSTLMLNITDIDRNNITVGTCYIESFWVTKNASNSGSWDIGKMTATSDGIISYYFMQELPSGPPSGQKCDYGTGIQKWKGGISDDGCYKDINSSAYDISINSSIIQNITNVYGQGYLRNDKIPITSTIYDDCSMVDNSTLSYSLVNLPNQYLCNEEDNTGWNASGGWYNCTWDSANKPYKWYNVTATASKPFYVQNSTSGADRFFLGTTPKLDSPSVSPTLSFKKPACD